MESTQGIKSRLRSVKGIGQITKAMEVVAATKMRRAQVAALDSRPYAFAALATLSAILEHAPDDILTESVFVKLQQPKTTLIVLVASERGLAGSFNQAVARSCDAFLRSDVPVRDGQLTPSYRVIVVGKRLLRYAERLGFPIETVMKGVGDVAEPSEVRQLADSISSGFANGSWERVVVVSTHFKTTLSQFVVTRELLPFNLDGVRALVKEIVPAHGKFADVRSAVAPEGSSVPSYASYIFEPSPAMLLNSLLPHLLSMQLLHLILEANASEHSARMVAMKHASDNAGELSSALTLSFNKARQEAITKEMIEITSSESAIA